MKRISPILPLFFVAIVVFVSGCTAGLDPQALAASNAMIKQFMAEHPNAKITATHFTAEQAKNIIDQVRKDCDNPYMDEKDYYRVTINDTATNFFAVVWIDWQNKTIECAYKLGGGGVVIEKPKPIDNCTMHAYAKCHKNNLYWFDSCGNVQNKKEYCQYGCSGEKCLGECKSNAHSRCYGDHVYWFDSCGNVQDKKEYCNYGCDNGFCKHFTGENTCEEAGGYCIWSATVAASGAESGGQSASTGMVVAIETTATRTVVTYQCRPGYEIGKHFCRERGICCVPSPLENKCKWEPGNCEMMCSSGYYFDRTRGNCAFWEAGSCCSGPPFKTLEECQKYCGGDSGFCGTSTYGPCTSDDGCITGGCSGEVCQSKSEEPVITTCNSIAKDDCYNSDNYGLGCKCVKLSVPVTAAITGTESIAGQCQWTRTSRACTQEAKICPDGTSVGRTGPNCEFAPCPSTAKYYRNAYWTCYDGTARNEGGDTSCKSYSTWKQYAEESCKGRCITLSVMETKIASGGSGGSTTPSKCGVSSFQVFNECSGSTGCTETDGGKNYHVQGTATANGQSLTDHCNSDGTLTEKFCSGDSISAETYKCPNGCKEGACLKVASCAQEDQQFSEVYKEYPEHCCAGLTEWMSGMDTRIVRDGSCVETGAVAGSPIGTCIRCGDGICGKHETVCNCQGDCKASQTCTDSDGGDNIYVKGITTGLGTETNNMVSKTDYCVGIYGYIMEYFCNAGYVNNAQKYCPNGCAVGACINYTTSYCNDSDGGKDYFVKGVVNSKSGGFVNSPLEDFCMNSSYLVEEYCDGAEHEQLYYLCPNGCSNGACVNRAATVFGELGTPLDWMYSGTTLTMVLKNMVGQNINVTAIASSSGCYYSGPKAVVAWGSSETFVLSNCPQKSAGSSFSEQIYLYYYLLDSGLSRAVNGTLTGIAV